MIQLSAEAMVTVMLDGRRCPICEWPLARSAAEGCVIGNCSYRPGRAEEQRALAANRRTFARVEPLLKAATRNAIVAAHLGHLRHGDHPNLTCALIGMVGSLDEQNRGLIDAAVRQAMLTGVGVVVEGPPDAAPTP